MTKRSLLTVGFAIALSAMFALAQGPRAGGPGGPGMRGHAAFGGGGEFGQFMNPMMDRLLDLTDAQKEAIRTEMEATKAATQPLREELRAVHQQIGEAVKSGASDSVLDGLADQVGNLSGDVLAISLKSRAKIYNTILTAEQRTKLGEIQSDMQSRRKNRRKPPVAPEAAAPAPNGF